MGERELDFDEVLKKMKGWKDMISPYTFYSSDVKDGLDDLSALMDLLSNPNKQSFGKIREKMNACRRRAEPYTFHHRFGPEIQEFLETLSKIEEEISKVEKQTSRSCCFTPAI